MSTLTDLIAAESARDTFPAAKAFGEELRTRYGAATAGVVFYGSCLRQSTDVGLMLDFYVLVDSYRRAVGHPISAAFAALLPPNVYYHEMPFEGRTVRAKVAVIAVSQFLHGTGPETFASSLWARFSQPALILYARNSELHRRLVNALAAAVQTTIESVLPLMETRFTAREVWLRALAESYGAELRPEQDAKRAELVEAELPRYDRVTTAVLGAPDADGRHVRGTPDSDRAAAAQAWRLRRIQGKTLNALRLVKAAFTFQGGLDYAVWKIERHSGVKIELTPSERKRPLMTGARLFLQTLKRGGIR
jgi:hypothetical protein